MEAHPLADGPDLVLVQTLAVGICGTDREIAAGAYGTPSPGRSRLVLGHEWIGRVLEAPAASAFRSGELVTAIVRHPDPVPCASCAAGEWDMCVNGRYTEHGITGLDGFCADRVRVAEGCLVRVDPAIGHLGVLTEPASVVAKAWEQIERIGARASWQPRRVLVTGAGPIGLLAAMMAVQRGYDVHVIDRVTAGPKPDLVRDLGATYSTATVSGACAGADITLECTGVGAVVLEAIRNASPSGIVCLTGISSGQREIPVNASQLGSEMVLENNVVFGSVNANRRHYELGAAALARASEGWLARLITRRVPLERWADALAPVEGDVKVVIEPAG